MVPYTTKNTMMRTDRKGYKVELILIHETAGRYPGDLNWLIGSGKVGVNWYIAPDGAITCLDDQFGATAHAGPCAWGSHTSGEEVDGWGWANLASEGIEVAGLNDGTPFTAQQIAALVALVRWRCQVRGLGFERVVRHLDIARPVGRKTDPKGLKWEWFKGLLQPPAPPAQVSISGSDREYTCTPPFRDFYDGHGGLLTFGFPLSDEFTMKDVAGEDCRFMKCENAWLKLKPSQPEAWRLRPASLAEVLALTARG